MNLSLVQFLLVNLIVAIAAYMAANYVRIGPWGEASVAGALTPEVRAYIDEKLAAGQPAETATLQSRIAEMEKKLVDMDKMKKLRDEMLERRKKIGAGWKSTVEIMKDMRKAEVDRLRADVAKMCAGVSVTKENVSNDAKKK